MRPTFPGLDQHIAIAGMPGSGKTVAAIDMLSRRLTIPWLIVDHKQDETLARLPSDRLAVDARILPDRPGLYHVKPKWGGDEAEKLEDLLERIFRRNGDKPTRFGVYVDEGHLMGKSPMVQKIMVAGRSKIMPLMWISQRAQQIDPFIWSQSTFYRAFRLQTPNDRKRFNENFLEQYYEPDRFHSHYFDGVRGAQFYLAPASPIETSINRIDSAFAKVYRTL